MKSLVVFFLAVSVVVGVGLMIQPEQTVASIEVSQASYEPAQDLGPRQFTQYVDSNQPQLPDVAQQDGQSEQEYGKLFPLRQWNPIGMWRQNHQCNEDCPHCTEANKYRCDCEKVNEELAEAQDKSKLREEQWEHFYNYANRYVVRHGLPPFERRSKQDNKITGAVNDGVYGEGRPATGDYGQSRPNSFGSVKVSGAPAYCPSCQRGLSYQGQR